MSTMHTVIREAAEADLLGDPLDIATMLYDVLSREQMIDLIAEEVAHQQRRVALIQERKQRFAAIPSDQRTGRSQRRADLRRQAQDAAEEFRKIMDVPIALGDGGPRTTWGACTRAQHRIRLQMLRSQRDGIEDTIQRHERALAILEAEGVDRLEEIPRPTRLAS